MLMKSFQELMELEGRASYDAKAVPVRDKEINEHERLPHRPIRLGVLGTGLHVRVCFYHFHQLNFSSIQLNFSSTLLS
jgi:hypothetical protein